MNIANKTILVTGANRGIGRALLEEALRRGARKVYAGTRGVLQHSDKRVTPLTRSSVRSRWTPDAAEGTEPRSTAVSRVAIAARHEGGRYRDGVGRALLVDRGDALAHARPGRF